MPAGPDETDNHAPGAVVEHVMKNSSSKTDNNASTHPLHDQGPPKGEKVELRKDEGESKGEDNKAQK
ncbi:hypothetical protein N0V93_007558 [Gnomoniopsis smithogilvyi]|uniref:Uncharacterized protein n=1 Tax=Gnomoniopsis smithogilvyi TaxID=1191159 RepID=A0A9W8YQP8_9PEZI|nr:hypothetical protein N0V93_007558 [Gnomoniopsis smithogilvyi]